MGERRGLKGLELWCKHVTAGYPGVKIDNMTTSWRDGLAFCAIINHFRPDLIDFNKLNKDDVYRNNELAFRVAQQYLNIPALLEAEDMVQCTVPDRLSILTYLSQFYNTLARTPSHNRQAAKRTPPVPERNILPSSTSAPTKMAIRSSSTNVQIPRREPCVKCNLPVFLVERVVVGKQLYHNSCFRCARCDNPLSAGNYYETEVKDQYCCEVCPNEESVDANNAALSSEQRVPEKSVLARSLSDEEKASSKFYDNSAFKSALDSIKSESTQYEEARSHFIQELITESADTPPELPKSKPPDDVREDLSDICMPDSLKLSAHNNSSDTNMDMSCDSDVIITKEYCPIDDDNKSANVVNLSDSKSEEIIVISDDSVLDDQSIYISDDSKVSQLYSPVLLNEQDENNTNYSYSIEDESKCIAHEEPKTTTMESTLETSLEKIDNSFSEDEKKKEKVEFSPPPPTIKEEIVTSLPPPKIISVTSPNTANYSKSLNPFGSDDDDDSESEALKNQPIEKKEKSLNPFSSDEEEEESQPKPPKRVIKPRVSDFKFATGSTGDTPEHLKELRTARISVGPSKTTSFNPFSSDDDEEDDDDRTIQMSSLSPMTKSMTETIQKRLSGASFSGSTNSLASSTSSSIQSTLRKKKPAPKPPTNTSSIKSSPQPSHTSSPSTSAQQSPKPRKSKRAPLPPNLTSTPDAGIARNLSASFSPIGTSTAKTIIVDDIEIEKVAKDEANRQAQESFVFKRNKSTYGKWKRKKGQAPSLPVPQKRTIKALPMNELKKELDIIDLQLQGLIKQGVRLEKIIRDMCEGPGSDPTAVKIPIEAEDLILQLCEVVNERNELFRRQAELMHIKRQHRFEEEQADIEYQIRCLMSQSCKTDTDKARETELIERLVEVVNLRAEIVDSLEMDRVRGIEEDESITTSMNDYANKRDEALEGKSNDTTLTKSPKKGKKKFHKKLLKFKRLTKVDADKDVDESETNSNNSSKGKKKK